MATAIPDSTVRAGESVITRSGIAVPSDIWEDPTAGRKARRALGYRDPKAFFRIYFSHYQTAAPCEFHDYLAKLVYRMARESVRANVIGARELAKSVWVTVVGVIYCVAYQLRRYVVLLGNEDSAQESLSNIVRELETNVKLRNDFGHELAPAKDLKKQLVKWSDKRVILGNGSQIRALTLRQSLRGKRQDANRPDLLIPDDPQTQRDLISAAQREQQYQHFLGDILGGLDFADSAVVCVANRNHKDSIPAKLERSDAWESSVWPAIQNGKSTWPARQSLEALEEKRRQLGPIVFRREYLCETVDVGGTVFASERFRRFVPDAITWGESGRVESIDGDPISKTVLALDPSAGFDRSRPRADRRGQPDCAAYAVGCLGKEAIWITDGQLIQDKADAEAEFTDIQIMVLIEMTRRWSPDLMFVENVAFQRVLRLDIERALAAAGIPIRPQGVTQSIRKTSRISGMQGEIMRGDVRFSTQIPPEFLGQFDDFRLDETHPHDDAPDVTEIVVRNLRRGAGQRFHFGPSTGAEKRIRQKERASYAA